MTTNAATAPCRTIEDPEILHQINQLRHTDNFTNWCYLAREYFFLLSVICGTILLYEACWENAWSLVWAIPWTFVAILCVGAGQHRLATLGHEAAHYMLFKNRLLNELAAEWFCMFPIFASTHRYRLQHLGHHRHTNDPELDPDLAQLQASGHRFEFPLARRQFFWHCLLRPLLWLPSLLRYVLVRATFHFDHGSDGLQLRRHSSGYLKLVESTYYLVLLAALLYGHWNDDGLYSVALPGILLATAWTVLALAPATWFCDYSLKSELSDRRRRLLQLTFNSMMLCGLAWLTYGTGKPWWLYYLLLWLLPAGTSFAFFMLLGQLAQHGNAGGGRFVNTRIFLVHPLIRMAVFPIGNDYHVAHHLFLNVPHYNLAKLHALLMQTEPYRRRVRIVTGYFFHDANSPQHPTVVDVLTNAETGAG